MPKKCTKCGQSGTAPAEFRPERCVCRKCENKDRVVRLREPNSAVANFEADQKILDAAEAGGDVLASFGTPIERCTLSALLEHGSVLDAAAALQLKPGQLRAHFSELQRRAAGRGNDKPAPPLAAIPDGYRVKGVSTLVDADGVTRTQWIKTTALDDSRQVWLDAIRSIGEALPRLEPTPSQEHRDDDLLSVFAAGDPHVGLLAWHADSGESFNLKIAERNLVGAFEHLIALAPPSAEALLIFIGDNTHSDGQGNTTTKGTRVDVDGRTIKMCRTFVNIVRRSVELALAKHARVTVIIERGNHDELLSAMLALALSLHYENEPRVTIDTSPEMFHWYRFGNNLIGTHHGHNVKPMDLLGVMAVDRKADWGETTHRRMYTGHYHHMQTKEVPGIICETLPTLAGSDAWHRGMGYRSQRAMYMDVIHRKYGHINRHIVGIQQITESVGD